MKTALLTSFGVILLAACISNPVSARENYTQDYLALSLTQRSSNFFDGVVLHGPTNDPMSTATGGPSGGLPDSN